MKEGITKKTEDRGKTIPSQHQESSRRVSMPDNRAEAAAQRKVQDGIQSSPVMLAQKKQLEGISRGTTLGEGMEGEGLIQGKFVTQHVGMDEEELK